MRFTSEVWKGATLGVAMFVAFFVVYAVLGYMFGGHIDPDLDEHLKVLAFLGRILLAGLLPAALVGGLIGALGRNLRKARTLKLAGAALLGSFVVIAATFAIPSTEPLTAAWFGLLIGVVFVPLLGPFSIVGAVILERWTRPGARTDACG
ncbi:hypothetical protein [Polyangium sp. 15x6]|uniref:hypothetical protein n=1 Tax=Polyangium sp. 15x6 TaxID=3042687 RepID=UPI00249B7A58|nr:hypothetical protein [Polyangium sp. 15x6]MDI3288994.1 hypothetical protein [Polyangium sp. 15x6]